MFATLEVPEHDGSIIPAAGEQAAVGTHFERMHHPRMRLLHPHALQARHLPPAQPAVTASTAQPLPAPSPSHRRDHSPLPHKAMHRLSPVRIPHEHLPPASLPLATATCRQSPTI